VKATWLERQEIRSHPMEEIKDRHIFLKD